MSSTMFRMFGKPTPNMGGIGGVIQQFQQFRQSFRGDPKQQVQQLLNSGKISQEQYNRAVQMAQQLQQLIGSR